MDDYLNLSNRFERLHQIIVMREQRVKDLDVEVLHWFGSSNVREIEKLMRKKESILSTNQKLLLFILKWEKDYTDFHSEHQFCTSV